ncbi:hypothetical protein EXIGLDRAFT_839974 [Exidia glandulosa HHB12029]|uniref:Uncharacterized protein n=1 Tax=Exidia glandulosa HHB12029 TaxID=1314781 RepID=A0A165EQ11_EXIGL|nr:hypothetical protein EXIGLDRAFT_839974 [Exidia glandulosa HHB12029]
MSSAAHQLTPTRVNLELASIHFYAIIGTRCSCRSQRRLAKCSYSGLRAYAISTQLLRRVSLLPGITSNRKGALTGELVSNKSRIVRAAPAVHRGDPDAHQEPWRYLYALYGDALMNYNPIRYYVKFTSDAADHPTATRTRLHLLKLLTMGS